ncbi:MAG TPA: GtrA family protein [Micromonospora sp.]|nr:GtrA family protein [Micromonospora sp.]
MRLVRLLPDRWRSLFHEVLKFGTVGGINTIINYAVFNTLVLTVLVTGQLKATIIAATIATISSYLMNRYWTYRDRPRSAMHRESALFFLFNATGLLIELGALGVAKYGFGITGLLALNVAKTVGLFLGTVFRFWSYRTFVFKTAPPSPPAAPAVAAIPAAETSPAGSAVLRAAAADVDDVDDDLDELVPLGQISASLDAALAAEFAIELEAADRRPAARGA